MLGARSTIYVIPHFNHKVKIKIFAKINSADVLSISAKKDLFIPCAKHFLVGVTPVNLSILIILVEFRCFELKKLKKVMSRFSDLIL